jgi:hypothetical protein
MENLAVLAFLFIVVVLAIVGGVTYLIDSIADRHDQADN